MSVCTVSSVPLTQFQFMTPAGLGNKYLYTMDPAVIEKFNPRGSLIPEEISPSNSNIYHHASEAGILFRYLFVLNLTKFHSENHKV